MCFLTPDSRRQAIAKMFMEPNYFFGVTLISKYERVKLELENKKGEKRKMNGDSGWRSVERETKRRNQRKESEQGTERQVVGMKISKEAGRTQVPFRL